MGFDLGSIFKGGAQGVISGVGDAVKNVVEAFKLDPAVAAQLNEKIQEAVMADREAMQKLAEAQYETALKDTDSARNREIAIANSDKAPLINKITLPIIAAFVTLGFFGLLAYMLKYDVPQGNKDILNVMLGSLGTAWISIVGYYFGSSRGSDDKNEVIKNLSA